MQVIFRGAYWLRFWAPLQHDEQTKDILSMLSKNLETIALEFSNRGWKHFFVCFSTMVFCFSVCPFLFSKLCNNWLCTSSNV